jgi:predicted RNA-binding Zn ribbon-like protein
VDARPGDDIDVEVLNAAAAAAPWWPQLHRAGEAYAVSEHTRGQGADAALAAIARDAIAILGGPLATQIRSCQAPGCVLFFVKDHPRRQWCSAGCGNRARAARHYHRHRARSQ